MQACRVYHFHDTGSTAGFKQASSVDAADFLYHDAANIAAFLYRLKNSTQVEFQKSYHNIVRAVKAVTPFFHDFYLQPRGDEYDQKILLKWLHTEHGAPFSANQLSDGSARFICLACLFLQPVSLRAETIILDEPELGLHPAALDILSDLLKSAAQTSQVICSTQSVTFANNFTCDDFIVVDQKNGKSTFKRLDQISLTHWLTEYGMGDILDRSKPLY
jgi:predicted ATPase